MFVLAAGVGWSPMACADARVDDPGQESSNSTMSTSRYVPIQLGGLEAAIVPAEAAVDYYRERSGETRPATAFWTPTAADVEAFEVALANRLAAAGNAESVAMPRLGDYARQYLGILGPGGERRLQVVLVVPSLLEEFGLDLYADPVAVEDGGSGIHEAEFTLGEEGSLRLEAHGEG